MRDVFMIGAGLIAGGVLMFVFTIWVGSLCDERNYE